MCIDSVCVQSLQTNRIIREFTAENFMRVNIRDENMDPLCSLFGDLVNLTDHVGEILRSGIQIGDAKYDYLASSNSQIRTHSCWFVEEDGKGFDKKADIIRQGIGDLQCTLHSWLLCALVLVCDSSMVRGPQQSRTWPATSREWAKASPHRKKRFRLMHTSYRTSRAGSLYSRTGSERYRGSWQRRCGWGAAD